MATYLLLDGYNLVFRSFYAIPELNTAGGFPTNAIHGWVRALWKLQDDYQPDGMVAFFDLGGSAQRLALAADYKATRAETPEDLKKQVPPIKELTRAMGIPVVEEENVEADDHLASLAIRRVEAGHQVYMVSADKDLAQVIRPGLSQLLPPPTANPRLGWRVLDEEGVRKKFGVEPGQIADYLALIGDTSDNIPGLEGVGPKTAAKWLQAHGDLETIIAKAAYLTPKRFQVRVPGEADRLRLNLQLVTLDLGLQADVDEDPRPRRRALIERLEELEMQKAAGEAARRYPEDK